MVSCLEAQAKLGTGLITRDHFITDEDRAAFERNGYFVVRNALTPEEVQVYRDALVRLLHTPTGHPYDSRLLKADIPGAPPTEENPRCVWAAFDLPLFDERFWDFAYHPKIALAVSGLIGPDVNLYETSCVAKVPGFPGHYRDWHQDSEYSDPQSNDSNVTVITYLDDQDGNSGATCVVPGTHNQGPLPHVKPSEEFTSGALEVADKSRYDAIGYAPVFQAGDTMIFYGRLVHKSGPNNTGRSRLSLAYNYVRADTLDLKEITRYIGSGIPIVRNGRLYAPRYLRDDA